MTPQQQAMVLQLMAMAVPQSQAARVAGLTPGAISMKKGREPAFAEMVETSEAKAQLALLAIIWTAAKTDPKHAQWILERRWPAEWARAEIRAELTNTNVNVQELAKAIHDGLELLAKRHAPKDAADVDAPEAPIDPPSLPPPSGDQVARG
jgi:hypothetical protein